MNSSQIYSMIFYSKIRKKFCFTFFFVSSTTMTEIYLDPSQPVEARIKDLMSKMTIEEKVGQLVQLPGYANPQEGQLMFMHGPCEQAIKDQHVGSFLWVVGENAKIPINLQKETRLKIPLLFGVDAIHGLSFIDGSTLFPTQLGMAPSWDEDLLKEVASTTAKEMRYNGTHWTFSPVLCIARDLRWGRVGETFGEDPYLIGRFASAMIKGYQGDQISSDQDKILACAKHYAGYSETIGGRDASEADLTPRKLLSYFLPQFKKACEAGVGTYMTGYQSIDGTPSTANQWLLREILKEEWGFKGFLVTDWYNVGWLVHDQKICKDFEEAAAVAITCGNDMIMATPEFYEGCLKALKSGKLEEKYVDEACERILRIKFQLGLFEDPRMPDISKVQMRSQEALDLCLRAAQEGAVLLKNDNILPLCASSLKKAAVVGPNADHPGAQNGDWAAGTSQTSDVPPPPRENCKTVLDGVKANFQGEVLYCRGASIDPEETSDFSKAIEYVNDADVTIVVVGDRERYWGESKSTCTLELQGDQIDFLNKIVETGKPFILDIISSKPLVIPANIRNNARAIIQQFSPGQMGGQALANIVFGKYNPSGRLTISIPYHVGQQPIYYNQVRGQHATRYADMTQDPCWAFGYGLSYSKINYESATINQKEFKVGDNLEVTVTLKNESDRDGIEVVQVYIHDEVTSATWAVQELKGFERVTVKAGETKQVKVTVPISECSIVNTKCQRVVEPGTFQCRVGRSSNDFAFVLPFEVI
ncbi:glycosyl hydrolase [Tritrichomonas foetus]|uniref:beta-glucosidase n=1 Tax=Tritrichomonas foetus TaxID=1144522 RepID=A0A1J4JN71_9EUKA|nr:glycosyl hydrolase [Tritrichomonas foetus]|eukprot:OHT00575.1 glycosyl hydrolase [Tritrichomonas foetus]